MGNFKYRLKEAEIGDTKVVRGIKYTISDIDPETGAVEWSVESAADFESVFNYLAKATKFFDELITTPEAKGDFKLRDTAAKVREAFNLLRTHLRKNYPDVYEKVKMLAETSTLASNSFFTSGGEGENHTGPSPRKSTYGAYTQAGYKKVNEGPGATMGPGPKAGPEGVKDNMYVKKFKYKLVDQPALNKAAKGIEVKQLWTEANTDVETYLQDASINDPKNKKFVASRILAFDELERKLNQLVPLLQQAKHKTLDYYKQNPASFGVVYGTDLANDYLNDLIELFKE
jgi:hypothetical protein